MKLDDIKKSGWSRSIEDLFDTYTDLQKASEKEIYALDYSVQNLALTSLAGCPKKIKGHFDCSNNRLTSLTDGPVEVNEFDCSNNKLTSLADAPKIVHGDFYCDNNEITSLIGSPKKIDAGSFRKNKLTAFEGSPEIFLGSAFFSNNLFTSLKDIHKHIKEVKGSISFRQNNIQSHTLGLLKIKYLTFVYLDNLEIEKIINKYINKSKKC